MEGIVDICGCVCVYVCVEGSVYVCVYVWVEGKVISSSLAMCSDLLS